ncbi:MAG: O-antigen ligase family protein [Candidatus Methylomirabilales bacterium]
MTLLANPAVVLPGPEVSGLQSDSRDRLGRLVLLSLAGLLIVLPLFDGGRSPEARVFFVAFVSLLFGVVLLRGGYTLPVRGYILLGLCLGVLSMRSVYFDLSLQASLLLLSYFLAFSLTSAVCSEKNRVLLLYSFLFSSLLAAAVGLAIYLLATPGSLEAHALRGTFHYPNGLVGFLLLSFYPSAALFLHAEGRKAWGLGLANSVLLLAVFLTRSRGGWLAFLLVLLFWVIEERALLLRKWRRIAAVGLLVVAMAWVGTHEMGLARYAQHATTLASAATSTATDPSFHYRRHVYGWALQIFLDHPLLGTGPGTFPLMLGSYQDIPYISGLYAHNHYLQTGSETGLLGLLLLLAALGWLFWNGFKVVGTLSRWSVERSMALGLLAALLASAIHAGIDFDWSYPAIALGVVVEAALLLSYAPILKAQPSAHARWISTLAVVLVVGTTLLAFSRFYAGVSVRSGKKALQEGMVSDAEEAFRTASRIYPLSYASHYWLSVVFAEQGKQEEAVREAEAAFRLNPYDGHAHHHLGKIFWRVGELDEAERALARSVELEPSSSLEFYADLGRVLLARGQRVRAQRTYQRAVEVFTPERVLSKNARCLAPADRYVLAGIFEKMDEVSGSKAEIAQQLRRPDLRGICREGLKAGFTSPEATILTHWDAMREGKEDLLLATYTEELRQRFHSGSPNVPSWARDAAVSRIVEMTASETEAWVIYEVTVAARRLRLRDRLKLAGDGWRLARLRR